MAKIGAEEIREIVLGAVQERISSLFAKVFAQDPYFKVRFPLDGFEELTLERLRQLSNGYFVICYSKNPPIVEMAINSFEKALSLFRGEVEEIQEKGVEII